MTTGTPLDLTPFGALLKGIGIGYWLVVFGALALVLWKIKGWMPKMIGCSIVLIALVSPVVLHLRERNEKEGKARANLEASMALFKERCEAAGEKINRTVENVDGVVWMKWRDEGRNYANQFRLDDPYGRDCGGEGCIADLLRVTKGAHLNPEGAKQHNVGYRYVEARKPSGELTKYVGAMQRRASLTGEAISKRRGAGKEVEPGDYEFTLERNPIEGFTARYGITWEDISTRDDRSHWIAGGSLKILDLQTNEVVAERIGYMMDRGQGSTDGFRSPWGDAPHTACPAFPKAPSGGPFMSYRTRDFVIRVLQPVRD